MLRDTLHNIDQRWQQYQYKHTSLALSLVLLFVIFFDSAFVVTLLGLIEQLGYIGGFIAGILSASFFTAAPAVIILINLADKLDPFALAVVGGAGSMVGDWLLLLFFQESVGRELRPLIKRLHLHEIVKRLRYKYTAWILWVVGAISLATPLPDEIGIAMLGISHIKKVYLLGISFTLNTIGIFVLVLSARALNLGG